jgi:hypothetical protein
LRSVYLLRCSFLDRERSLMKVLVDRLLSCVIGVMYKNHAHQRHLHYKWKMDWWWWPQFVTCTFTNTQKYWLKLFTGWFVVFIASHGI